MEWAKKMKKELRRKGIRVAGPLNLGGCVELVLDTGPVAFYAYLYPGRHSDAIIVKAVLARGSCSDVLFTPVGLFAIVEEPEEAASIISRLSSRISRIAAVTSYKSGNQ